MTLDPEDYVNAIRYMLNLRIQGQGPRRRHRPPGQPPPPDDRRAGRRRAPQGLPQAPPHRPGADEPQGRRGHDPAVLINPKSISAAIEYFFGRGELSQVVDQTNPLAQLTHERRLSASGPGGLNRKRAGLRGPRRPYLALRPDLPDRDARRDEHRPDQLAGDLRRRRRVRLPRHPLPRDQARPADREGRLDAGRRGERGLPRPRRRPASDENGKLKGPTVIARYQTDFHTIPVDQVQYMDISPKQMVGVSAGPDPVPRARRRQPRLMGSNMQRQAVPLLVAEPPIVATGLEQRRSR